MTDLCTEKNIICYILSILLLSEAFRAYIRIPNRTIILISKQTSNNDKKLKL